DLTAKGRADLIAAGVDTIVDLREPKELEASSYIFKDPSKHTPPPFYINMPLFYIPDRSILVGLTPPKIETIADAYTVDINFHQKTVGQIISTIASVKSGSVVFHCHAGKDRTGIISAFLLEIAGVPRDIIVADYAESEHHLQPLIQQWLAEFEDPADRAKRKMELASLPETMFETLERLDQKHGSVEKYLLQAGVTEDELAVIRSRLRSESL
ncbi:MAG: tyrosine-protein phosphatase, partial [Chloroflexota bacterium]